MTAIDFASRLQDLRQQIIGAQCAGFLVPMADQFQSEYVPPSDQRIQFLSGFSGSAGFIVVLEEKAAFFTDSRYTIQAKEQVNSDLFSIYDMAEKLPSLWITENAPKGSKISYDPWLHCSAEIERLKAILSSSAIELVPCARNLVDAVWAERPEQPMEPAYAHDIVYVGKRSADKRHSIAEDLKKKDAFAALLCDPASVAWLLNVRGNDVANTPLPLGRAIIFADAHVEWFIDPRKVKPGIAEHVGDQVAILSPEAFESSLDALSRQQQFVLIDAASTSSQITDYLTKSGCKVKISEDPCELPKAIKNAVEIDGMKAAHRRDGAALVKFFSWLEQTWPAGGVTELAAESKLAGLREANNNYRGPSFDTIAGVGAHGAIVHYRATATTDVPLKEGTLFLLDSGGQYLDGTTDVTRTISLGQASLEMRERFTRVLKGHIALATIRFPDGTTGAELDVLARQYLWEVGLDYGHGTGHGVGCFLGVHEGPQAISKRNKVALKPGMVLSNEPGYYKAGHYGIRIENLQVVVEVLGMTESSRKLFGFETLTLVPIDRRLIEPTLLTDNELKWINSYHLRVRQVLRSMVDESTSIWLEAATLPIEK